MKHILGWDVTIPVEAVILALGFSVAVGIFFGFAHTEGRASGPHPRPSPGLNGWRPRHGWALPRASRRASRYPAPPRRRRRRIVRMPRATPRIRGTEAATAAVTCARPGWVHDKAPCLAPYFPITAWRTDSAATRRLLRRDRACQAPRSPRRARPRRTATAGGDVVTLACPADAPHLLHQRARSRARRVLQLVRVVVRRILADSTRVGEGFAYAPTDQSTQTLNKRAPHRRSHTTAFSNTPTAVESNPGLHEVRGEPRLDWTLHHPKG